MRLSAHLALVATALLAGCSASNRCGNDCCGHPVSACQAPGCCVVNPTLPGYDGRQQPIPEVAPGPPMEPSEPAPEPPDTTAQQPAATAIEEGEPETQPVSTIAPEVDITFGHDAEYGWMMGRLQRVHVPGGEWKLRYAPLDQEDRWGGSVVLATDVRLDAYADGDIVYIEGEILAARPTLYLSGPLYRVRTIRPASIRDKERIARQIQ